MAEKIHMSRMYYKSYHGCNKYYIIINISRVIRYLRQRLWPTLEWHHLGRFLALPAYIRLGWKLLPVTNVITYPT